MKTQPLFSFILNRLLGSSIVLALANTCEAQLTVPAQPVQSVQPTQTVPLMPPPVATQTPPSGPSDYVVAQVGPDSQVWQSSTGQSVTTLATGMNYWNGQQWNSSDPSFVVSADGTSFVASKVEDPTTLAANLNSQGAVRVSTPDGVALSSTPTAIGLYDAASGQAVIIAALTNSIGVLVDPQHVLYTNAFVGGGLAASVVYSMPDAGSFHQDVIFTAFNPNFDPTVWGFAATSTNTLQIQVFTEFYNPPQPQVKEKDLYIEQDPNVRASMASPDFIDYSLDFGHYVFGPGFAYPSFTYNVSTPGISTAKDFVTQNGRTFLVESVKYKDLVTQLQALPPVTVKTSSLKRLPGARRMKVAAANLPQLQPNKLHASAKIITDKTVALNSRKPTGVDVDYFVTLSSLTQPTLYTSDTTYFVTNNVYLASPVTIESAVFKFTTNTTLGAIVIQDSLTLATTNYRPAIFTGADDDTAGSPLNTSIWSGYTGILGTKLYGTVALSFHTASNITLNNLRFINQTLAINAVAETPGWSLNVSHSQIVGGLEGIAFSSGGSGDSAVFNANNCLFASNQYPFLAGSVGLTGNVCNCTIGQTSSLTYMISMSGGTLNFTNSILSYVGYGLTNGVTLGGSYNGFVNTTPFGTFSNYTTANPYQWTWAGSYYLTNTTSFTTNGTTNISPALLAQLRMKTTQAPQTLSIQFTEPMTLAQTVQRDTTGLALGFHYDSLDYIGACGVSNTTLTLAPGVAIAYYDNCLTWLQDGSHLVSQGTPNQRNYIVYYNSVQEQPLCFWPVTNFMARLLPFVPLPFGSSSSPSISLRLTTICAPTGETNLWFSGDYGAANVIAGLTLQDCEVYGSGANWEMNESANTPNVGFTNNVFYRVPFAVNSNAKITSFNNLFYGTTNANEFTISILHRSGSPSPNTNENNVFDGVAATLDGVVGYNAYLHGATNTSFTNNHDIITNLIWQGGPLGSFYQLAASPLINKGSTSASNLDLFYYTVTTNLVGGCEIEESNSIVDLGYHYVAVTNGGIPITTTSQGVPDYLTGYTSSGIANAWLMEYFGTLFVDTNADFDGTGSTVYQDYQAGVDPNIISFTLGLTNQFLNNASVPLQFTITAGMPSYMATLVDDTNTADAHWIAAYSESGSLSVYVGTNQGWHQIMLGFRGLPATGQQTWALRRVKLDTTPPILLITNPLPGVVTAPVIQLQGYSAESLGSVSYNISNSTGLLTNQAGYVTAQHFDTNSFENTTNNFECFNISLANGTNIVTLRATDLAGNVTTTNLIYNLNPSANTNPPVISLTWPQNNTYVSGANFTLRGMVSDPFASVTAEIIDGGVTNSVTGEVEQNGSLWVENLPLGSGTNYLTITATNLAGYGMVTNIALIKSGVTLTIDSVTLYENYFGIVSGTISAGNYAVYVNGVQATNNGNGTWTSSVTPYNNNGTTTFSAQAQANGIFSPTNAQSEINVDNSMGVVATMWEYALNVGNEISYWTYAYSVDEVISSESEVSDWQLWQPGSEYGNNCTDDITANIVYYYLQAATWDGTGYGTATGGEGRTACGEVDTPYTPGPITAGEVPPSYPGALEYADVGGGSSPSYTYKSQWRTMLYTGGKSIGPQQNLWIVNASVSSDGVAPSVVTVPSQPPSGPITIAGQTADASGNVYLTLPNNTSVDVTPHASSTAYTFGVSATEYTPQIQANGITLSASSNNATFCVGQQVTFTATFSPSLPSSFTNIVYNWKLPDGFVNSSTSNSSSGCVTYTNATSLYRGVSSNTCVGWYVSGIGGIVNANISIKLPSGNIFSPAVVGQFAIYTPQISGFSAASVPPLPIVDIDGGYIQLDNFVYSIRVYSQYSGNSDFTQIISRQAENGTQISITVVSNLDNNTFYQSKSMSPPGGFIIATNTLTVMPFSDSPNYFVSHGFFGNTTSISDQFVDYVMFGPSGANNIYVPLGTLSWSWTGSTTYTNGNWTPPFGVINAPTGFTPGTKFPQWTAPPFRP